MTQTELFHSLTVEKKIFETADTASFVLSIPAEKEKLFNYLPGQFISLRIKVGGQETTRSYSLSSTPKVDSEFKITVKRVPGGLVSNYLLDSVREGDHLLCSPPAGRFFRTSDQDTPRHLYLLAGGSGITPIFSILKHELHNSHHSLITLLFANRSEQNIIFAKHLEQLENQFSHRLEVFHILNELETEPLKTVYIDDENLKGFIVDKVQAMATSHHLKGLLTSKNLETILNCCRHASAEVEAHSTSYYLCGPDGLMAVIQQCLHQLGIDSANIHLESFTSVIAGESHGGFSQGDDVVVIGDGEDLTDERPDKVIAILDGETIEIDFKNQDSTILEAMLEAGHNPPYSCMEGTCMACLAKLKAGRVYQENAGILTEENIAAGDILTCQAKPLSKLVKIDFDEL